MSVRVREISILLGALLGLLALFALQTGASGQSSGATVAGEPVDSSDGTTYVAGELIVTYEESATETTQDNAVEDVNGEVEDEIEALDAEVVEIPTIQDDAPGASREQKLEDAKEELENAPGVRAVDYDYIVRTTADPDDEFYYEQYGLDRPKFPAAWNRSSGEGAKVAIVDTGIVQDHEDFNYAEPSPLPPDEDTGKILRQRDFVDDDLIAEDGDGHGTHVAGTVTAATNNETGVAGACPDCDLLIARSLGSEGTGTVSDVADAIAWAANQGADVINLSLGGPGSTTALRDAVNYAYYEKNVVIVAAAGNDGSSEAFYPAAYPNAISVAATNSFDRRAEFSNFGATIDVAAPGVGILSTFPGTDVETAYRFLDGTSMASPHVAALAGLLVAQDIAGTDPDNRSNTTIRSLILTNAKDLGTRGRDQYYGSGRINAGKTLRAGGNP